MSMAKEASKGALIAHVGPEMAEQFRNMCADRHQPQTDVLKSLVRMWLKLPLEVQARLLCEKPPADRLDAEMWQVVQRALNDTITAGKTGAGKPSKAG